MGDNFFHEFPYTNMEELNLDWVISQLKKVSENLDTLEERVKAAAIEAATTYVNERLQEVYEEFNELENTVSELRVYFDDRIADLNTQYNGFIRQVQNQITLMTQRIDNFRTELDAAIIGVNARTDQAIAQNNEYIIERVSEGLVDLRVINPFTGTSVTLQDMFNTLAGYHLGSGLTAGVMAERALTAQEFVDLEITAIDLLTQGDILYNRA